MVSRVISTTICDKHLRSNKDVPAKVWTVTITPPGGKPLTRRIAACDKCDVALVKAYDLIATFGETMPKATNGHRTSKANSTPKDA